MALALGLGCCPEEDALHPAAALASANVNCLRDSGVGIDHFKLVTTGSPEKALGRNAALPGWNARLATDIVACHLAVTRGS